MLACSACHGKMCDITPVCAARCMSHASTLCNNPYCVCYSDRYQARSLLLNADHIPSTRCRREQKASRYFCFDPPVPTPADKSEETARTWGMGGGEWQEGEKEGRNEEGGGGKNTQIHTR